MAAPSAAARPDPLAPWLEAQLGVRLLGRRPVGGGCIHRAWRLELAGVGEGPAVLFAKTNRAAALPLLQAEAEGLAALATFRCAAGGPELVVPQPLALGVVGDPDPGVGEQGAGAQVVLVLPWLALGDGSSAGASDRGWWTMGAALATLHRRSAQAPPPPGFGWAADNFIGSSLQVNGWEADWSRFFWERRLVPQLTRARVHGVGGQGEERLLALVAERLEGHHPEPVLVHGDLWSGNAGLLQNGRPALYDPAVSWADREVDLAMAQLFGGFPQAFFRGYEDTWPLPPGHGRRVNLYNLYHLLNHLNLFGGAYRGQVEAAIGRLGRDP